MKIECGKYTVYSDKFCYWVTEKKMTKPKIGDPSEIEDNITGYYPTPDMLFNAFIEKKARGNDAKTAEGVLKKIAIAERDAKRIIKRCIEEGLQRD